MLSFASKHSAEKKIHSHLILILASVGSPWQKQGSRTQCPKLLSFTKSPRWHMLASSQSSHCSPLCSPWPWKTLSNWPWQLHIISPAHCPCLYLQVCVWCFFEDWKSYRSSLNLRGQAKQTGREQDSSGCLTHTGFEITCRPRYLLLNMHIVCTPSVYWLQRHAVKQICLGVNTSTIKFSYTYSKLPSSYNINANKQTNQKTFSHLGEHYYWLECTTIKGTGRSTASLLAKQHSHCYIWSLQCGPTCAQSLWTSPERSIWAPKRTVLSCNLCINITYTNIHIGFAYKQ